MFLVSSWNPAKKSANYLVFLFSTLTSVVFFMPTDTYGTTIISPLFPWVIPFFYLIGPSFFKLTISNKVSTYNNILLLFPFAILSIIIITRGIFYNEAFNTEVTIGVNSNFSESNTFLVPDRVLLVFYPLHMFIFAVLSLIYIIKQREKTMFRVLPIATILFTPLLIDLVYSFVYAPSYLFFPDDHKLRGMAVTLVAVVIIDSLFIPSKKSKNSTEAANTENRVLNNSLTPLKVTAFISSEIKQPQAPIFTNRITPVEFYDGSPYSSVQWSEYFKESETSYALLKKRLRVERCKLLISEGYLELHSIDSLSVDVGYSSRTSLYKVFKEIELCSLPEYRESNSIAKE